MKARLAGSVKQKVDLDSVTRRVQEALVQLHGDMFDAASKHLVENTIQVSQYREMVEHFEECDSVSGKGDDEDASHHISTSPGFFLAPWYDDEAAELTIKTETRATIRCFPLQGQEAAKGKMCFYSRRPATHMAIFARAF